MLPYVQKIAADKQQLAALLAPRYTDEPLSQWHCYTYLQGTLAKTLAQVHQLVVESGAYQVKLSEQEASTQRERQICAQERLVKIEEEKVSLARRNAEQRDRELQLAQARVHELHVQTGYLHDLRAKATELTDLVALYGESLLVQEEGAPNDRLKERLEKVLVEFKKKLVANNNP